MAVDLYPYSGRSDGSMSDADHELLWAGWQDGVYPGQAANALDAGISGGSWTVQPGRYLIAGHVLDLTTVQTGTLPPAASVSRTSVVVAYVNRTTSPWTYGVQLVQGAPGGGRPALTRSYTSLYQSPLRALTTAANGGTSLLPDERVILRPAGLPTVRAVGTDPAVTPLYASGASGQTAPLIDVKRGDLSIALRMDSIGRTGLNTNGAPSGVGLYVRGAASTDVTLRLLRNAGQQANLLDAVTETNARLFSVDSAGNLSAANFAATPWTTFTPDPLGGGGSATYTVRTGRWKRNGDRTVTFTIEYIIGVAGSGSTKVTWKLPTMPNREVRWTFAGHSENPGSILQAILSGSGSGQVIDATLIVDANTTNNLIGSQLSAGRVLTFSGTYEEAE